MGESKRERDRRSKGVCVRWAEGDSMRERV